MMFLAHSGAGIATWLISVLLVASAGLIVLNGFLRSAYEERERRIIEQHNIEMEAARKRMEDERRRFFRTLAARKDQ